MNCWSAMRPALRCSSAPAGFRALLSGCPPRDTGCVVDWLASASCGRCAQRQCLLEVPLVIAEPWVSESRSELLVGVAKDTACRWTERIELTSLPAHRVGRLWKFKVSEVDEWVRQGGAAQDGEDGQGHG